MERSSAASTSSNISEAISLDAKYVSNELQSTTVTQVSKTDNSFNSPAPAEIDGSIPARSKVKVSAT